jgi:hypothetical protein
MRQEEHSHRTFVVCAQHAATNRTNVRPLCRRTSAKPTEAASLVRNGTRQQVARDGDACGAQASLGQVTTSNRVHSRDWSNAGTAHLCVFVLPRPAAARGCSRLGTRGPEFESRRPDRTKPRKLGLLLSEARSSCASSEALNGSGRRLPRDERASAFRPANAGVGSREGGRRTRYPVSPHCGDVRPRRPSHLRNGLGGGRPCATRGV